MKKSIKKLSLLFLSALFLGGLVFFVTSCGDDEEAVPPTITLSSSGLTGNATLDPGATFKIVAIATKGDKNLSSYTVTIDNVDLSGYPVTISGDSYTDTLSTTAPSTGGSYVYTCKVTDKNDKTKSVSITITVEVFGSAKTGQFYHIAGPSKGAYDLVSDIGRSLTEDDALKDMMNTDAGGSSFTGSWQAGTGNNTLFIKDNTYDYTNAGPKSASEAYASGGTGSSNITNPALDDVYIAKLRSAEDYAVIKITLNDPTYDPTGSTINKGKIEFTYKKK